MKPFENLGREDRATGNGHTERRPGDIEQEIQDTRRRMQGTLDAIKKDLSPGQMIDQALHSLREGRARDMTSSAVHTVSNIVRANPLPAALIGVGVVWLAASQRSATKAPLSPSASASSGGPRIAGEAPGFAPNEPSYVGASYGGATFGEEPASEGGAGARARAKVHGARERVSHARHNAAERARGAAHSARDKATAGALRAREATTRSYDTQPLVIGAIAVGIGALLGALLPSTAREDRLLGARRDEIKRKVDAAGAEVLGRVQAKVDEGARRVQEKREQRGQASTPPAESERRARIGPSDDDFGGP